MEQSVCKGTHLKIISTLNETVTIDFAVSSTKYWQVLRVKSSNMAIYEIKLLHIKEFSTSPSWLRRQKQNGLSLAFENRSAVMERNFTAAASKKRFMRFKTSVKHNTNEWLIQSVFTQHVLTFQFQEMMVNISKRTL